MAPPGHRLQQIDLVTPPASPRFKDAKAEQAMMLDAIAELASADDGDGSAADGGLSNGGKFNLEQLATDLSESSLQELLQSESGGSATADTAAAAAAAGDADILGAHA